MQRLSVPLRCAFMNIPPSHSSAMVDARDIAARRCVSLMFASAIAEFTSQPVSVKQEAEIEAASDEWEEAGHYPPAAGLAATTNAAGNSRDCLQPMPRFA